MGWSWYSKKENMGHMFLIRIIYKPPNLFWWNAEFFWLMKCWISWNIFQLILKFFHYNDNVWFELQKPWYLGELRQLTVLLHKRCKKVYTPKLYISLDRSLEVFKGKTSFQLIFFSEVSQIWNYALRANT